MSGACQSSSTEQTIGDERSGINLEASPELQEASNQMENHVMSNVMQVNQQNFQSEVLQSELPVVVDFFANWCPPCRALGPILDRLAGEFAGQVKFVKVNSDEEEELASQFKVTGLPTLVFIENGTNVGQSAGLPPESQLRESLTKWIAGRNATAN